MATPLEALQNRAGSLAGSLTSSPTAYAPNTPPSYSDLSKSSQLASVNKRIENIKSTALRNEWYGPSTKDVPAEGDSTPDGWMIGGLKALQRPLNAVVGAGQYVLGKGTQSSLAGNINQAMKTGLTSGDVLKQFGAPRAVQVPLGFALDVMFDPVNWATAGSAALIPRVGMGLVKGVKEGGIEAGLSAAKEGLLSGVEKKATSALNMVPFAKKLSNIAPKVAEEGSDLGIGDRWRNLMIKGGTRVANAAENIGKRAVSSAEKYDTLTGSDVYDKLGKGLFGMPSGIIGNTAENLIRKVPSVSIGGKMTPSGEQIADFFKYSTKQAADVADLKDKVINLAKDKGALLTRSETGADFQSIDDFLKPNATINIKDQLGETTNVAIRDADGALNPDYYNKAKVLDTMDNAKTLLESAGEDYNLKHLIQAYKVTPAGKTGVQWFDDVVDKLKNTTVSDLTSGHLGPVDLKTVESDSDNLVKNWNSLNGVKNNLGDLKPFQKMLNAQQSFISLFKSAKVPMNVSSHVVANIGNFFMGAMMGLPMWKPEYLESMAKANLLVKGRLGAAGFKDMFFADANSLIDMADNNPTRFKQLTGIDPSEIANKLSTEEKITSVLRSKSSPADIKKVLLEGWANVEKGLAQGETLSSFENVANEAKAIGAESKLNAETIKKSMGRFETPSEKTARMLKEAPIKRSEEAGTWTTGELTPNQKLDAMKQWVAKQAEEHPRNPAYRVANTIVNSMPRWYEHIDQSYKIGTADYLTKIGLTDQELTTISRTVPLTRDDILEPVIKGGQKLYRLTPLKASEVATEAFMNYAAMPDFVRVMRALPLAGSPFMSFPYAMAIKTAKTAINNPALFNKIGFMINEMNADRSPAEKAALEDKYNQYLKSPTVVKITGMWNTDVKNMIPYFQMNMFNPSERTYDNSIQGQILKMTDKIPAFQDPVGGMLKDYFIQPWILSGTGQIPQGSFGEPIYPAYDANGKPINVGLGTKALYGTRTLAESMVPGVLGYAGLLNIPGEMSPETVNLVPSYGFRNLANATQGRSSVGAMTKEDAVRKSLRSFLGRSGIPAYTLDTSKVSVPKK